MVLFGTVASLVLLLGVAYVGWRLGGHLDSSARCAVWIMMLLFLVSTPATFMIMYARTGAAWHGPAQLAGYIAIGLFSLVFAGLVTVDACRGLVALLDRLITLFGRTGLAERLMPDDPARRAFVANAIKLCVLGIAGTIAGLGYRVARQLPVVEKVRIPVRGLPKRFHGFRIVQISDVHTCPSLPRSYVEGVVRMANDLRPDLLAITGDLVDGKVPPLREQVEPFRHLKSRLGTFFCTGNHEYFFNVHGWLAEFERLGMTVLNNRHEIVELESDHLVIAGVTDYAAGMMEPAHATNPAEAIRGAPEGIPRILLAHNPASAYAAADAGFDVMLCGHSHGGQYFPWNLLIRLVLPFPIGLNQHKGMQVYTNRGTGYWGPPIRTGGRSEITQITLVPA